METEVNYSDFEAFASQHLTKHELRQFERAFADRANRTLFLDRFVTPQLYRPDLDAYLAVDQNEFADGRNHYVAQALTEDPSLDWSHQTYFTNAMRIDHAPEAWVDDKGRNRERFVRPMERVVKGLSQAFTFEFDQPDLTFFKTQLSWMRSSKHPTDCKIGELYRELSRYCDFEGITVAWSGNKSFHIHVVFSTSLLTVTEGFRNGFMSHWTKLYPIVTGILNPGIDPDMGMNQPEKFRRLPGGTRTLEKTSAIGIPARSHVPQLVMWEKWLDRAPNGSQASFWDRTLFIESKPHVAKARSGKAVTALASLNLNSPELTFCGERLRDVFNGETVWPRFDHWTVNDQTGELRAKFTNDFTDLTPDSYMDLDWKSVSMVGTGRGLSNRSEVTLSKTLGEMIVDWLDEYQAIHGRVRTEAEQRFAEQVTDGASGAREIARILLGAVRDEELAFVCAPEGVSKTTSLFKNHQRIAGWLKASEQPEGVMYAFGDYKNAQEKADEFNARANSNLYHAVVLRSFDRTYKDVCQSLGVTPMSLTDAAYYGAPNLWTAIEQYQPTVIAEFARLHDAMWTAVGNRQPVFFTVHAVASKWAMTSPSRLMWAPSFWTGQRDGEHTRLCRSEMVLGLLIHDEVKADNLVAAYPKSLVDWVKAMTDSNVAVWHNDNSTAVARYNDFHAFQNANGGPFLNGVQTKITFEQATDVYMTANFTDWEIVTTKDSGEYDAGSEKSIYGDRIGKEWCLRERRWPLDTAKRTVILTTEAVPLKIAKRLNDTGVIPWTIYDLDTPRITRDTVETYPKKAVTSNGLMKLCAGWRAANPTHFIVSNKVSAIPDTMTHAAARGSNKLMGETICQTMTYCSPDEFEYLEALNAWCETDDLIRHRHIDEFNQTAGRNLGFRKREGARHILLVNRNLFERLTGEPKTRIRYAMELVLTRTGKEKAKATGKTTFGSVPAGLVPDSQLKLMALAAKLTEQKAA
ncbi:hypothetical protein [Brevundimonas sp. NPDC058933]|uniref:hypothetical protein n=1 Tax=Brevundimonas sp. NPDC058933 TaxID=3346673 RepID=UPI003BEF2414